MPSAPSTPTLSTTLQRSRRLNSLSELASSALTASSPICPLAGRPRLLVDAALGLRGSQGAVERGVGWSLDLSARVST